MSDNPKSGLSLGLYRGSIIVSVYDVVITVGWWIVPSIIVNVIKILIVEVSILLFKWFFMYFT